MNAVIAGLIDRMVRMIRMPGEGGPRGDIVRTAGAHASLVLLFLSLGASRAAAQEVVEYYGTDVVGSIRVVFDASGNVKARSDYLPFGEEYGASTPGGPLPTERFAGQQRDAEEGHDNFNARALQTRHGRFTRPDPLFAGVFEPQSWNRYSYAHSNPLSFGDPTGLYVFFIDPFTLLEPDVIVYGRAGPGPDWAIYSNPYPRGGWGGGGGGGGGGGRSPGQGTPPPATGPDKDPPDDDPDPEDPGKPTNPKGPVEPTNPTNPKEPGEPEPEPECQSFGQRWTNSVVLTHTGIREFFDPWPANPVPFGVGLLKIPRIPYLGWAGTPSISDKVNSMYYTAPPGVFTVFSAWRAGTGVATAYATVGVAEGALLAGAGVASTAVMLTAAAEVGIFTGAAIDAAVINRCGQ